MKRLLSSVKNNLLFYFAAAAKKAKVAKNESQELIKKYETRIFNDNLRFDAEEYELFMIPKHPEVDAYKVKSMIFNSSSVVLELIFLKKGLSETKPLENWKDCKSLKLSFHQLGKIIDIQPGKSQQYTIKFSTDVQLNSVKHLYKVKDSPKDERIQFWLKDLSIQSESQKEGSQFFTTSISYEDFQLMQEVIKESLFDLSGLRLMLDIRCMQELQKTTKKVKRIQKDIKQTDDYYNNSNESSN